tara:strand:- start:1562 stop:1918 length:357 start_codon:yes stop_codon:yes gene_type:complete
MVNHKKVYCNYFGYDIGDVIKCEMCLYDIHRPFSEKKKVREAVDVHHIISRGAGGAGYNRIRGDSKYPRDYPENLVALCRECHQEVEKSKEANKRCKIIHLKNIIKKLEEDQINSIKW